MPLRYSIEIRCTPEQLFPFIEQPEHQVKWMRGVLSNEMTSEGPTRVSSTFRMKIKEGAKVAEYDGCVTAYNPPREMAVRFWGGNLSPGMAMRARYVLEDVGLSTRLDYTCDMEFDKPPLWMKLMMPLFLVFGKLQLRSFMRRLKKLAESEARS